MIDFDINKIETPYYAIDERLLEDNLKILKRVKDGTGAKILLAQKAFSTYATYPLIAKYLDGATALGLFEAKLGKSKMKKENHIFSPAYKENEIDEIISICDHIIFNSITQLNKYKYKVIKGKKSVGIRINPNFSTQEHGIYDPCSFGSRLGIRKELLENENLDGVEGLHFHTLCEQNVHPLIETLKVVERDFDFILKKVKWVNFGGGHHITRADYDVDLLIKTIKDFKEKYDVEVYLEPGEAVALNSGYLVTTVMDIVENDIKNLILDTSPSCHMPDVIEMPYRPNIIGGFLKDEKEFTYRLGGPTCLAGDIIGDYSFEKEIKVGDKLIFLDMAIYSMVKNNTFNGICLPTIAIINKSGIIRKIKSFSYKDFKRRI